MWRRRRVSVEEWANSWEAREENRLEKELQEVMERVRTLNGEKRRLMLKAIIGYVNGMIGK